MKRPTASVDIAAWQRDTALRSCSLGARGLWMDMRCLMSQASMYGYLLLNGEPIAAAALARLAGSTEREVGVLLAELEAAGALDRDDDGLVYSPQMVHDERVRAARAAGGRFGGNPALVGRKDNHRGAKGLPPQGDRGPREMEFAAFLRAWPVTLSSDQRLAAARAWRHAVNGEAGCVMEGVEKIKINSPDGEIPDAAIWLEAKPWVEGA